jgi:hypothetical protein
MVFILNDQKQNHKKEQGYPGQYAGLAMYNTAGTISDYRNPASALILFLNF